MGDLVFIVSISLFFVITLRYRNGGNILFEECKREHDVARGKGYEGSVGTRALKSTFRSTLISVFTYAFLGCVVKFMFDIEMSKNDVFNLITFVLFLLSLENLFGRFVRWLERIKLYDK